MKGLSITMPMLQQQTKADEAMQGLMEDISHGMLRMELEKSVYKDCFQVDIPKALRVEMLQTADMGQAVKESMTRMLRRSYCWPEFGVDTRDFM